MSTKKYSVLGGMPLNGLRTVNDITGEQTVDNKAYTVEADVDTGVWYLVAPDGSRITLGAAVGAGINVTKVADLTFADLNGWGVVASHTLDLASARPINSTLVGLAVVPVTPLENSGVPALSAKITAGLIAYPGSVTMANNYVDAKALKLAAGITAKADMRFAGGVSLNVVPSLLRLDFTGWDTVGNIAADLNGLFTAGEFKVYAIWSQIGTAAQFANFD